MGHQLFRAVTALTVLAAFAGHPLRAQEGDPGRSGSRSPASERRSSTTPRFRRAWARTISA
jgi:hypothetical protein